LVTSRTEQHGAEENIWTDGRGGKRREEKLYNFPPSPDIIRVIGAGLAQSIHRLGYGLNDHKNGVRVRAGKESSLFFMRWARYVECMKEIGNIYIFSHKI
jgi:hypothetical protein